MKKIQKATLLFLIKDDQILLAMKKRGFGKGYWNGVGGKIEFGETSRSAAIREAFEEIKVTPKKLISVGSIDFIFETWIQRVAVYTCSNWIGEPIETAEMRPKWFKIEKIPFQKMWPDDILWLPKVLKGEKVKTAYKFTTTTQGEIILS